MNQRLRELVEVFLVKTGKARTKAKAELAAKIGINPITLDKWIHTGFPDAIKSYKTALACGCSEAEALEIAKECLHKATG